MKVIEQKMIQAIKQGKPFSQSNTDVVVSESGAILVYLFNNLIAEIYDSKLNVTFAGWATPTTRSRLNAILTTFAPNKHVSIKQSKPLYFDGKNYQSIDESQWVLVTA